MLQKNVTIKIDEETYELGYPNVGQKLEIESYKLAYSLGTYAELARNGHKTAVEMLDIIDAVSYFRGLSRDIDTKYNLKEFSKIDFETSLKLRKAYKVYAAWISEFETQMYKNLEDDETTNGTSE